MSSNQINKNGGEKDTPAPTQQTTTAPPLPNKTIPDPRVNKHKIPAAVPRGNLSQDKEVHILPSDETQEQVVPSLPVPSKGTHMIPLEEDSWGKTPAYIHKYNTRSSPRYAFAAAMLKMSTYPEYCNHVLQLTTGTSCSYRKLSVGRVPGQSVRVWKKV